MRILIVSHALPYPPNSGFTIRVYQLLKLLSRRHSVSLLALGQPGEDEKATALRAICAGVHTVPYPQRSKRGEQLLSLLSSKSYQSRYLRSAALQQRLDELCAGDPFDIIMVETSQLATVCSFDRRSLVVLNEHDIVYELLERMAATESSPFRRLHNRREYIKFKREEEALWRQVSAITTTSSREVPIISAAAPATPILAAPNGVDMTYFSPSDQMTDPDIVVMTGFMKTRPNIDAALYFVHDVLPRLLTVRPRLVFHVVGGDPPEEIRTLAGPHVVVAGTVPDVRPYVARAGVFVVPMRMGGGTRLKVLEALAMKKPLVSTSLGCEGIDVRHGEHLLVADDAGQFAESVIRLLDDRSFAFRLADEGYELVRQRYRWEAIADQLEAFCEELRRRQLSRPEDLRRVATR
jgi:sugar transferase (PEP-CTERM/EpsH1 system associated)